ncbi:hypothetical protein JAB1_24600 [Janthinobacterium sp. MP5059B]|uniref:ImmA/IrrE family metallo-endopeptidase n=1 Tax=Janthinobacterium sp. MP5059B TaxID=1766683 RepID=UPI000874A043|nr:ImmA/IrrE family metallo-endopeptidase [Janthinobacterium sp. MP5059B]OEZ49270.1 hypothetical protein JAB1_24600 [Janthinobacterium sp. MP5059B]
MTQPQIWTPPKAASKIVKLVDATSASLGLDRFPLDVPMVAQDAAQIFGYADPITKVQPANIKGFQGALLPNDDRSEWMLLYNDAMPSLGRVRFTQAHELGHYVLHRMQRDRFECGSGEVLAGRGDEQNIETQADQFASYLLMPINDFAKQINGAVNLDFLGHCADRYGVSLTAAVLKWLEFTDEKAVMLISSDGFVHWARSSTPAYEAGAFFAPKRELVEIPARTLAADDTVRAERVGREIPASAWFKHADPGLALREMKLAMDQYERTLTLLVLPKLSDYWPPFRQ